MLETCFFAWPSNHDFEFREENVNLTQTELTELTVA